MSIDLIRRVLGQSSLASPPPAVLDLDVQITSISGGQTFNVTFSTGAGVHNNATLSVVTSGGGTASVSGSVGLPSDWATVPITLTISVTKMTPASEYATYGGGLAADSGTVTYDVSRYSGGSYVSGYNVSKSFTGGQVIKASDPDFSETVTVLSLTPNYISSGDLVTLSLQEG